MYNYTLPAAVSLSPGFPAPSSIVSLLRSSVGRPEAVPLRPVPAAVVPVRTSTCPVGQQSSGMWI